MGCGSSSGLGDGFVVGEDEEAQRQAALQKSEKKVQSEVIPPLPPSTSLPTLMSLSRRCPSPRGLNMMRDGDQFCLRPAPR